MNLWCRLFGHDWKAYEKNPHRDTDDGYAHECQRCGKWDW